MRINMAMENRIPGSEVAIARSTVVYFIRVPDAWRNRLRVEIRGVLVEFGVQPLMRVQVEYVRIFNSRVHVPDANRISDVGMVNVRRIVGKSRARRVPVGIICDQQGGVAIGPRVEEEFLELAFTAILGWADGVSAVDENSAGMQVATIGQVDGSHSGSAVVHREIVTAVAHHLKAKLIEGLDGDERVVKKGGELAERLPASARGRRAAAVLRKSRDDCIAIGRDDLVA